MAAAVLSNIASGLISKLSSLALNEIGLRWGIKDDLDNLKRTVSRLEDALLHADELSIEKPGLRNWLVRQSEAMYDADDLLDEISTEALRQQAMGGSKMAKKVRHFFSPSKQFAFGIKMGHQVKEIRETLDEIAESSVGFLERSAIRGFLAKGRDQTHSSPPQVVVGREHDKEAIVEVLLSSDCEEYVSIVPIVGIGGLGKTTLAKLVYNDDRVQKHFELKMWVCLSNDFHMQLLMEKVIESATGNTPIIAQMDPLKKLFHEKINGRRYLLVLDDVRSENVHQWSIIKDLLAGGARGSKIVITTRSTRVAEMSQPICIHELRALFQNEAWSLFKQLAFKQGQVLNRRYEALAREIVAVCGGVPLSINILGGMLYFKDLDLYLYSEWLFLKNEIISGMRKRSNGIFPILKLSYDHLPPHYKHCIAYCSLYSKDIAIPVEELINLWKAQGYVKPANLNECLQDVGFGYFMHLFRLSFFQDVQKDEFGNITVCRMHDSVRVLAISVAAKNFSWFHPSEELIKDKSLHMSLRVDQFLEILYMLLIEKKLRTLVIFGVREFRSNVYIREGELNIREGQLDAIFRNLRCLRVLKLSHLGFNKLPSSIYELKHVRYLDISKNEDIKILPDSITNLLNLQVFILSWCVKLMKLPKNINKLVSLTDLDNYACFGLTHMPRGIGQLTRLEKLSRFSIAKDHSVRKHSGGLDELHALNNLRGELEITNLSYVKKIAVEFKAADLSAKKKLQKLTLDWSRYEGGNDNYNSNDVANDETGLEALRPPQSLKGLSVVYYRGVRPPSWLPSLTNLVSICFGKCRSIQWLPPFDLLPYLKSLTIDELSKLERIDVENGGSSSFFPSLTALILRNCPNLKGFVRRNTDVGMESSSIMDELPCFPSLSELDVRGCPNLTYMPLFWELKRLITEGNSINSLMEILKMTTSKSQSTFSYFLSLSQLERLSIAKVEDLPLDALPQYLPSLQHLEFKLCTFKTLSDEKDDGMHWRGLQVLNFIEFNSIKNLVSLPKGLQYVTTLQHLCIHGCDSLASIPEWMGNLIELEHLIITDCPQLSERCKNNTAEDWPKISHIPNISIENQSIQRNGRYLL